MINEERIVIGYKGLVGKTIYKIFDAHMGIDIDDEQGKLQENEYRILHVCIPFTKQFVDIVTEYIRWLNSDLTLVHTTCPPGTTREIYETINHVCFTGL